MGYKLMNFVMLLFVCSIFRKFAEITRPPRRVSEF
nr:venom polypeptide precursor [Doratifera vulnerans]